MTHEDLASPGERSSSAGGVSERFRAAACGVDAPGAGPLELLPTRLAQVCSQVLAVDGAGLSVFSDDFRLPLGASDDEAATAERLQFTAAEGPCWEAVSNDLSLSADADTVADRWPQYNEEFSTRTSYRAVASVPLRLARGARGALDVYFRDEVRAKTFDLGDATAVAAHIADILDSAAADDSPLDPSDLLQGSRWMRGPAARSRNAVWIAVGMLISDAIPTADDALAVLRATAYSGGVGVDELAAELVAGRLTPEELHRTGPGED